MTTSFLLVHSFLVVHLVATLLMVGIMAAHALGEGSGVGVSFSGAKGWAQGQLITLAIGVHNIPEGMAVATVLAAGAGRVGGCRAGGCGCRPRIPAAAVMWCCGVPMASLLISWPR